MMFGRGLLDETMSELELRFQNPKTEREYRDRAIFLVMSRTGLRAAEVCALSFSQQVRLPGNRVAFSYTKKGGRTAYAIPGEQALHAVREYHRLAGIESDAFFLSLPNRAKRNARNRLGVRGLQKIVGAWNVQTATGRKIHPHALRHSVGAKLLETAGSIAAQKTLGHSSPRTTSAFYTPPFFDGSAHLRWETGYDAA